MRKKNAQRRSSRGMASTFRPALTALALAASAAANAQFFSSTGDASSSPVNVFPLNPAQPTYNLIGSSVSIGGSATGTLSGSGGGVLLADALSLGNGGTGVGTVTLTGAGTRISLGGTATTGFNRLEVGNWGVGSLSVLNGAVVDASSSCAAGQRCNSFIGNAAGSSGVLNITGTGSTVSTIGFTGIGWGSVFTVANDGFQFGTPGGTTNGAVNITAGGRLNTQVSTVGSGPNTASALGTEVGIGSVVIDGVGSRWVATRDTVNGGGAFVGLGSGVGGQGTVIVRNGGQLLVDDTGSSSSSFATLFVGYNGGSGSLTVTGTGSSLALTGANSSLAVGRSGATGQGTLQVLDGGTASALFLNVGRDGANGSVTIDGAGSQLSLLGVSTPGIVGGGTAFATIGRDGGTGSLAVSNGGRLFISDNGGDSRAAPGSPGFIVGRGAGTTGTMTITGPGSVVEVSSTSRGVPVGTADNFNPFVAVGFDNVGSLPAQLQISNGGRLVMTGNGVSDPAFGSATYLAIGGRNSGTGTGAGTVTVTGAGSAIEVNGFDRLISVGRGAGSSGTLNVLNGASVSTTSLRVGENATGTVNIDNALIAMNGFRTDSSNVGAGMTVGRGAGSNATLNMSNGARITIENNTLVGGMSIGGDSFVAGGTGSVSLSGGSSITFSGTVADGSLSVGRTGSGSLSLTGGSTVDVGNTRSVFVGRNAGGVGTLSVGGGSSLVANSIGIGGDSDTTPGGVGTAVVSGAGSQLIASGANGFIGVGRNGTGTLTIADQALANAIVMSVGRSGGTGTLSVNNGTVQLSGQQTAGFLAGAGLGVGTGGGTGVATFTNGSTLSISNTGSSGAGIYVGGSPNFPLGTGTLNVTNSTVNVTAAPGLATVSIGRDGTGTATFTSSSLNLSNGTTADGTVIIAGLPGSVGTMVLNAGSVINASYVGVGSTPNPAFDVITNPVQNPGGVGTLVLNDSTVNTDVFEIGALGVLRGNNGVINATGDVIVGGTIDPGNSAGRIRINCNLISLPGSKLILEIQGDGSGGFVTDVLVIDSLSTFDLSNFDVVFSFIGDTNVQDFAASGGFDFDTFLRRGVGADESQGLSNSFASGQTWASFFDATEISFVSSAYDVSGLSIGGDGGINVTASRIPEPATWLMMLIGLFAMRWMVQRRRGVAPTAH